jgi:predicted nuclease of predicted toxin-antitoxin system
MRLLLDQGLPRSTVLHLRNEGVESLHVGEIGLASANDATILDADFHALLALSGANEPSVIRLRIEGLRAEDLARLLIHVLSVCKVDLENGSMVTVTEKGIRVRQLPLLR